MSGISKGVKVVVNKTRKGYIDFIRCCCILIVFYMHFQANFGTIYAHYWHEFPTDLLLRGFSAKMSVAVLTALSGYLASKTNRDMKHGLMHRYLFFLISCLCINMFYYLYNILCLDESININEIVMETLTLGNRFFPALWFVRDYLMGFVLCLINKNAKVDTQFVILEIFIFIILGEVWIAIYLMGNLAEQIEGRFVNKSRFALYLLLFGSFFLLKMQPNTSLSFLCGGLACVIWIVVLPETGGIYRIINNSGWSLIGKYSWGFFLIHALGYHALNDFIFHMQEYVDYTNYKGRYLVFLFVTFIVLSIGAVPVTLIVNAMSCWLEELINKIIYKIGIGVD